MKRWCQHRADIFMNCRRNVCRMSASWIGKFYFLYFFVRIIFFKAGQEDRQSCCFSTFFLICRLSSRILRRFYVVRHLRWIFLAEGTFVHDFKTRYVRENCFSVCSERFSFFDIGKGKLCGFCHVVFFGVLYFGYELFQCLKMLVC